MSDLVQGPLESGPEYGFTGGYHDPVAAAEYDAWSKTLRGRLAMFWRSVTLNMRSRLYHLSRAFGRKDRYIVLHPGGQPAHGEDQDDPQQHHGADCDPQPVAR